jgi:hypothetical protein
MDGKHTNYYFLQPDGFKIRAIVCLTFVPEKKLLWRIENLLITFCLD